MPLPVPRAALSLFLGDVEKLVEKPGFFVCRGRRNGACGESGQRGRRPPGFIFLLKWALFCIRLRVFENSRC